MKASHDFTACRREKVAFDLCQWVMQLDHEVEPDEIRCADISTTYKCCLSVMDKGLKGYDAAFAMTEWACQIDPDIQLDQIGAVKLLALYRQFLTEINR